ncbi:uncharacterized protein BKA55DRAFT_118125 [Fusarium redolens]|uniref:Zn(2)-C6 fungal-type domain-containing protein n=1 Tax=Fusarium redolens TaxID=48865 RepID=A0A9P9GLS9_FUSRE|nr:uncharacterized protein BKA55DRAFT_118125 [Fusarium redolens]KAH7240217.1 hypothetical protein BKA55DRAFT_118125 [Fusarium redolens]
MSASPSSGSGTFGTAHSAQRLSTRVCDNCIRSKVRCDLGQPSCSRCLERGKTCSYSTTRRRPGPAPGSGRGSRATRGVRSRGRRHSDEATSHGYSVSEDTVSLVPAASDIPSESPETIVTSHASTQASNQSSQRLSFLLEEEAYL